MFTFLETLTSSNVHFSLPGASGHFTWVARCQFHKACWTDSWIGRCRFLISSPAHSLSGSFSGSFLSPELKALGGRWKLRVEKGEKEAVTSWLHPSSASPDRHGSGPGPEREVPGGSVSPSSVDGASDWTSLHLSLLICNVGKIIPCFCWYTAMTGSADSRAGLPGLKCQLCLVLAVRSWTSLWFSFLTGKMGTVIVLTSQDC